MNKDIIKVQYKNPEDREILPTVRRPLTQREAQIKQRFRESADNGQTPFVYVSDAVAAVVATEPGVDEVGSVASAAVKRHDPIGWLLKRFGVLFLIALTIGLLLLALPHGHANATARSHTAGSRPSALSPRTL